MSTGNRHVHRELQKNRLAFEAHSDTCEWPKGCAEPSVWYYTTVTGRYSLCATHCPTEYRTHPIAAPPPLGDGANDNS
jgi:hypothetical protein